MHASGQVKEWVNVAADAAAAAAGGTLRMLLNRQDAPLGPWVAGRGPLEDALQAFAGAPGAPPCHPWQAGLPVAAGHPGMNLLLLTLAAPSV